MKTIFHVRRKGLNWDWLRHHVSEKPLSFDSVEDAQAEITWRIQHEKDFPPGDYEIVPQATI